MVLPGEILKILTPGSKPQRVWFHWSGVAWVYEPPTSPCHHHTDTYLLGARLNETEGSPAWKERMEHNEAELRTNCPAAYSENNAWIKLFKLSWVIYLEVTIIFMRLFCLPRLMMESVVSDFGPFLKTSCTNTSKTVAPHPGQTWHIFGIITGAL